MSDGITAYYLTFDSEAVLVTNTGFVTPSGHAWSCGICDVTIFPSIGMAQKQIRVLSEKRAPNWSARFAVRRIYAPFPEAP